MSKKVKMRHPATGAEREFYEVSVPHHVRAGWELVRDPKKVAAKRTEAKKVGAPKLASAKKPETKEGGAS